DVEAAASMRRLVADELARLEVPAVLVTHDPLDAIVLARRAAILHDGAIVDEGPTGEVLGHPRTPFIAALAGVNLVTGVATARDRLVADGLELRGVGVLHIGSAASAVFSPGAVHVGPAGSDQAEPDAAGRDGLGSEASGRTDRDAAGRAGLGSVASASPSMPAAGPDRPNRWTGTVSLVEPAPGGVRIRIAEHPGLAVDVPSSRAVALDLRNGSRLAFSVAAGDVSVRAES
ncbi:MAG TPA: hypothetical protein VGE78_09090, partial [Agromyces sp.]